MDGFSWQVSFDGLQGMLLLLNRGPSFLFWTSYDLKTPKLIWQCHFKFSTRSHQHSWASRLPFCMLLEQFRFMKERKGIFHTGHVSDLWPQLAALPVNQHLNPRRPPRQIPTQRQRKPHPLSKQRATATGLKLWPPAKRLRAGKWNLQWPVSRKTR